MKTNDLYSTHGLYVSPSIKVIAVSSEKIICTSPGATEGYGLNDQSLGDGDFE